MNDADWFKKFRRGKRGGCTLWLGVGLVLVATVGVWAGGRDAPKPADRAISSQQSAVSSQRSAAHAEGLQ